MRNNEATENNSVDEMETSSNLTAITGIKDQAKLVAHLRDHVTYPATSDELIDSLNSMSYISDDDKKWFMENLPEDNYESAEEVINALETDPFKI